jgi:hypothetical protein
MTVYNHVLPHERKRESTVYNPQEVHVNQLLWHGIVWVGVGGRNTLSHPCKQLCPPYLLWALHGGLTIMLVPDLYGLRPSYYGVSPFPSLTLEQFQRGQHLNF